MPLVLAVTCHKKLCKPYMNKTKKCFYIVTCDMFALSSRKFCMIQLHFLKTTDLYKIVNQKPLIVVLTDEPPFDSWLKVTQTPGTYPSAIA